MRTSGPNARRFRIDSGGGTLTGPHFEFDELPEDASAVTTATLSSEETIELFDRYVIPNYGRYPISLVRGEGVYVWDAEGNRYLDLFPGWGCNILGYCPPPVVKAVQEQVAELVHVPNTWYMEQQGRFAQFLSERAFGKAFFCNSGAEAVEAAIKLARLHTGEKQHRIITFENGFHGRTYGAVTATAQPKYHEGIGPMLPGFRYAPHGDLDAVRELADEELAGILIEPVQGEGGVNPAPAEFLAGLREIADEHDAVLIFDEVQCGFGRTGTWFGYQNWEVQPDVITLGKGVAGGVACGGILATEEVAPSLRPGMHASTFGGNPIAMAAGLATGRMIEDEGLLENVELMAERFRSRLEPLVDELSIVRELRVLGMMVGVDLNVPSAPAVGKCMERGLLLNATHDTVIRMLPPLNVTAEHVDEGCEILETVLREMEDEA